MARKKKKHKDVIQKAIDYGIDIQMLKDNLKRSVAERIKRHQEALYLVQLFQKANKL
jgi:hypothetical protein